MPFKINDKNEKDPSFFKSIAFKLNELTTNFNKNNNIKANIENFLHWSSSEEGEN